MHIIHAVHCTYLPLDYSSSNVLWFDDLLLQLKHRAVQGYTTIGWKTRRRCGTGSTNSSLTYLEQHWPPLMSSEVVSCQLTRGKHKLVEEPFCHGPALEVGHFSNCTCHLPLLYKLYVAMLVTINDHLCSRRELQCSQDFALCLTWDCWMEKLKKGSFIKTEASSVIRQDLKCIIVDCCII